MTLTSFDGLGEGFFAVIFCAESSPLCSSQTHLLDSHATELQELQTSFGFVHNESTGMIRGYLNPDSALAKRQDLGELMLIFCKQNGQSKLLSIREKPESKYDWIAVFLQFIKNNANSQPDENNAWRFGQICPESGEYMCRDCGYIEEFHAGQIFPVCEVCLSGDPEGPVDTEVGYWEKL